MTKKKRVVYCLSDGRIDSLISTPNARDTHTRSPHKKTGGYENMKMLLCKVLHLFGLDVLLIKALEKLVTALTKKQAAVKSTFECFVCCHRERND